jgi:hypothetical protein
MTDNAQPRSRFWLILLGIVALAAGHGIILFYISSHVTMSATILVGVIALIVLKHLGMLRRFRRDRHSATGASPAHPK